MTKKKKSAEPIVISENAQRYFDLWYALNMSHEELEFDSYRKDMNELWNIMSNQDKRDFRIQSDAFERKSKFK
jgi:hypothetical protein